MTFKRFRSSLEQSLKTATRSRAKVPPPINDFVTITAKGKGKEEAPEDQAVAVKGQEKEKNKFSMLQRLESKVGLRRTTRESTVAPTIPLDPNHINATTNATGAGAHGNNPDVVTKSRQAGFTSFATPSLRQASMSSPALHLLSQEMSSPSLQFAAMKPSTNPFVTLARDRTRYASIQPIKSKEISGPQPLASRHEYRPDRTGTASPRPNRSRSPPVFSPPRGPSRRSRDLPSPPATPTPQSDSRGPATASATFLPLRSSPSPPPKRAVSPTHARTPSKPTLTSASYQGSTSASASHLQLNSSSPPTTPTPARRPSVDAPRRPSVDAPRPSVDAPRRPSIDAPQRPSFDISRRPSTEVPRKGSNETHRRVSAEVQRRSTASPVHQASSPQSTVRPRATSPQRMPVYTQNRHFNISTPSLISPSTPEQREVIRAATSLLCKELRKAPPHVAQKEWAEVEVRLQPLVRLERVWGKSGGAGASSSQVAVGGGTGSNVLNSAGEERERKLFCEALRDGVVLCQYVFEVTPTSTVFNALSRLVNKHCPGTITRIDHREEGFKHISNTTKFIAACSQHGVPSDDIFYRDDLIQATPETLCRVARTIISLTKLFENPLVDRAKVITGQGRKGAVMTSKNGPYPPASPSRATSSTPNLLPRSVSPTSPSGLSRQRWSPPERPDSRQSTGTAKGVSTANGSTTQLSNSDHEIDEVPPIKGSSPTPRFSFLAPSRTGLTDDSVSPLSALQPLDIPFPQDSISQVSSPSTTDYAVDCPPRQSRTSSNLTDNTAYSSIFDLKRASSSNQNKFGTIRTVTTEATSCSEVPSFTRTEASSVAASMAEELSRRRGSGEPSSRLRERRPSEPGVPDLVSLAEEEENSACGSSSKEHQRESSRPREPSRERETEAQVRVRLGKGKWPDDFLDAFKAQTPTPSRPIPIASTSYHNQVDTPLSSSPLSGSPARKFSLAGASRHNDSTESIPRRPTHRTRHSADVPPILMPKDSVLRLDGSPEGSPGSKVILRRQSTRNSARRNGTYYPRNSVDEPGTGKDGDPHIVPFPRAVSGEHVTRASPSPDSTSRGDIHDTPRVRGRFQSDVEDARARQRSRPTSDELGRPRRSRYESMVNLGVASANASASDLMSRDSGDGSAVRQTVIVKEEGKPATHFVSSPVMPS